MVGQLQISSLISMIPKLYPLSDIRTKANRTSDSKGQLFRIQDKVERGGGGGKGRGRGGH